MFVRATDRVARDSAVHAANRDRRWTVLPEELFEELLDFMCRRGVLSEHQMTATIDPPSA